MRNYLPIKALTKAFAIAIAAIAAVLPFACGAKTAQEGGAHSAYSKEEPKAMSDLQFSGDSALAAITKQVDFGPRKPGTEAHRKTGDWIAGEFRRRGLQVTLQETQLTAFDGTRIPTRNILASLDTANKRRVLIVAHWDTRPWADNDPDPAKRKEPVAGANDGASGVGVALELARSLAGKNLSVGVDFLMVDAEDWGTEGDEESWAMGTRYFVANPPEAWRYPEAVIVLDMVGDKNATFLQEYFSREAAPGLVARVWDAAKRLGYADLFVNRPGGALTDDHVPFIGAGIPAIDIVDYREGPDGGFCPQWHTTSDTPDKLSAGTLSAVGRTLESLLIGWAD